MRALATSILVALCLSCIGIEGLPAMSDTAVAQPMKRVYLAGPLGFSEGGNAFKADLMRRLKDLGYDVIDPFALTPPGEFEAIERLKTLDEKREAWRKLNPRIGRTNQQAIDRADAVLAILDGQDVDSGTAAEIGYAFARGKVILGYRGDFRLAADNLGSTVNLQVEYFIVASGGKIVTSTAEIPDALAQVLAGRP